MMRCVYFHIHELVSPEIIDLLGENGSWALINQWIKRLDKFREAVGRSVVCNTSAHHYRGIRPINCVVGADKSRHKLTMPNIAAFDLVCDDLDLMTNIVMNHWRELGIVRMENPRYTRSWRHIEFIADGCEPNDFNVFRP